MRRLVLITCLLMVAVLASTVNAQKDLKLFDTPETVSYLHAEVSREGSITLESTGMGARASSLEIWHTIPQGTGRQSSRLIEVVGADSNRFGEDEFGNEVMILGWNNPPVDQEISYSFTFDVEVTDEDDPATGKDFSITPMIEPDQGITQKAYELTGGLTAMEKFMELTAYVYDLVEYDDTYQIVQKSAQWVYRNQLAVCDGHANLLISMLRAMGYNAYYVIGYAYTEEGLDPQNPNFWGPHGWVEVEHLGKAISLDPTWLEHPVDATHIKFAAAPDSNYTEYVQVLASNVQAQWDKGEYRITMIDYEEEPRLAVEARVVNRRPGSGESSILVTKLTGSRECVLSSLKVTSCYDNGDPFFTTTPEERHVGFCGEESLHWLLETPDIRRGMEYVCGVTASGGGASERVDLTAVREEDSIGLRMSMDKIMTPGEFFTVETTIENTGLADQNLELFLFVGEEVQDHKLLIEGLQAVDMKWTVRAAKKEGAYPVRFFASSGDLIEEEVVIVEKRTVELVEVSYPVNVSVEEPINVNVTITGLENAAGEVRISLGDQDQELDFMVEAGEEKRLAFMFDPGEEGIHHLNVVVLTSGEEYQDGVVANVAVVRQKEWWEPIVDFFRGALETIFQALGM